MRALLTFLASRLTRALIAVWLVSTVVFVVMRLSGDPVPLLLPPDAPRSEYARVAKELGTDRALPVQYAVFLGHVVQADFGRSIHFREPAMRVAVGYLPATAQLGRRPSRPPCSAGWPGAWSPPFAATRPVVPPSLPV